MKTSFKHTVIFAVLFTALFGQNPDRKNMAIYKFSGLGVSPIEAQVISDRIRVELGKLDTYSIIERGLMEQILKEQVLQLSGLCEESSCLVEVGRILAVHYMVGGSVSQIGNLFTIEARIIDVESGEIVTNVVEDYNGPIENLLVQTTRIVAAKLCGIDKELSTLLLTGTCDLLVKSNPAGGTIYINDKPVGDVTPYQLEGLLEGDYAIKVRRSGLVGEAAISLARNERKELLVNLKKEQFIMRVNSEPEGASVLVNGESIGKTPIDYTITDTSITYRIQLSNDLYFDLDESAHFSDNTMLRLNYKLEPSGRIVIPYSEDISVYLNDKNIDELPNVTKEITAFSVQGWAIDQLDLTGYNLRIEKQFHSPFLRKVSLTPEIPFYTAEYTMRLLNANVTILSDLECSGMLFGSQTFGYQLISGQSTKMEIPFGDYTLSASTPGYLPIKRDLALFNQNPDQIALNFQRPDRKLALKRSLMFPGLGQIYSRQSGKGIILGVITSAGIAMIANSIAEYDKELDTYNELADHYKTATTIEDMDDYRSRLNSSRNQLNSFRNQFLIASSAALVSYSWNIYDITLRYPYE
jgi:TolB-like protein